MPPPPGTPWPPPSISSTSWRRWRGLGAWLTWPGWRGGAGVSGPGARASAQFSTPPPARWEQASAPLPLADRAGKWRCPLETGPGWTGPNHLGLGLRPPQGEAAPRGVDPALGIEPPPTHRVGVLEAGPPPASPLVYVI